MKEEKLRFPEPNQALPETIVGQVVDLHERRALKLVFLSSDGDLLTTRSSDKASSSDMYK